MSANPPLWLVLPTYNEADNLAGLVAAILPRLPAGGTVLIVDDASPDGTGRIADDLAGRHGEIEVLHRPGKQGLGPAYVAGFGLALDRGAGLVAQMDADWSHDPGDLPRLVAAAGSADLVLGSRYVAGGGVADWGPVRRLISRGGSAYARMVLGLGIRDLTGGYKVFRREVLERIDLGVDRLARVRVPGRDHLPRGAGRVSGRRGADHFLRPPRRRVEDDRLDRGRGGAAGPRHATGEPSPLNP